MLPAARIDSGQTNLPDGNLPWKILHKLNYRKALQEMPVLSEQTTEMASLKRTVQGEALKL